MSEKTALATDIRHLTSDIQHPISPRKNKKLITTSPTSFGINSVIHPEKYEDILMKNKVLSLLLSLFLSLSMFAQNWEKAVEPVSGFANLSEAAEMAREIVKASGKKANFLISEAPVPNAMAVVHAGKRYVLYNPHFIEILTKATGTKWAAISVLAHEIGHHLYSNSVNTGKLPLATELEADEFSGYVLSKLGASLEEAQAAMKVLASKRATHTHPGRDDRITSIAYGFQKAGGKVEPNNAIVVKNNPTPTSVLPEKNILATVKFDIDPSNTYFVTTNYNVVRVEDDRLRLIGKLAKLNDRDFPYMIYDDRDNIIYVKSTGTLMNKKGTLVGKMEVYQS